jgi:DNA-binding GntR family transcriptional regulator
MPSGSVHDRHWQGIDGVTEDGSDTREEALVEAITNSIESELSDRVQPVENNRLVDSAAEAIRASILDGRLAPGERLLEVQLAQVLGMSRAPLREALNVLEKDGIIYSIPRRGRFVQTFDMQMIDEVYSLRKVLELFAVARVIDRTRASGYEPLVSRYNLMEKAADEGGTRLLSRLDIGFHREVIALADHSILMRAWNENIDGKLQILLNVTTRTHSRLREALERHLLVLDAIRSGDKVLAEAVLTQHIDQAWARARSGYQEQLAGPRIP